MKKLMLFALFILFPLNINAIVNEVYLGGNTIGINVNTDGILIVGFYEINGKYNKNDLQNGDYIISCENIKINSLDELTNILEENKDKEVLDIKIKRNNKYFNKKLKLVIDNGLYKTGLYVKDSITGIGTLTFIIPKTNKFGALGHEIIDKNNGKLIEIKDGEIFKNYITSLNRSSKGNPGYKVAKYDKDIMYGTIDKNTIKGIYGNYNGSLEDFKLIETGDASLGKANIYTVLNGMNINSYEINITNIDDTKSIKNITFEITDEKLLNKTGGIIQGMSGSPIVQNNKLIGAVTHVLVDDPTSGYGIFIDNMINEAK